MKHRFVHDFEDDPPLGDFEIDIDLPPNAYVSFELNGKNICSQLIEPDGSISPASGPRRGPFIFGR